MLISALLSTLSATVSGCFFHGDDIVLFLGIDSEVEGAAAFLLLVQVRRVRESDVVAELGGVS